MDSRVSSREPRFGLIVYAQVSIIYWLFKSHTTEIVNSEVTIVQEEWKDKNSIVRRLSLSAIGGGPPPLEGKCQKLARAFLAILLFTFLSISSSLKTGITHTQ